MLKKHFIELAMAVLMLVCFYILSWEAAETAGRLIDVSGNIKADQVILVDAGHGGVDSGMADKLLEQAYEQFQFSTRAYHKILKTARTIADMESSEKIKEEHICEALAYRAYDKKYWS